MLIVVCRGTERASLNNFALYSVCDKHVTAMCPHAVIFKVFQIALVAKTLKRNVKLILNCPQAHVITYTKRTEEHWELGTLGTSFRPGTIFIFSASNESSPVV